MKKTITLGGLLAALVLSGCGGGSAGVDTWAPTTPPVPPPLALKGGEGLWKGVTTQNVGVLTTVLENGETWGVFSLTDGSIVAGFYGTNNVVEPSVNTLSGTGRYYNIMTRMIEPVTYTGFYSVRDSVELTASNGVKFSGAYQALYEQPAVLSNVEGSYSGVGVSNQSPLQNVPLTISSGGLVSITAYQDCSIRGALTSRASGRNVFDLTLNFKGTKCPLSTEADMSVKGVALYDDATRSLVLMGLSPSKLESYIYKATKSAS